MRSVRALVAALALNSMCAPLFAAESDGLWTSLGHLFERKEQYMGPVAKKVKDLHEKGFAWNLDFSPDGRYLAANDPRSRDVHIWDWQGDARIVRTLEKQRGTVTAHNCLRYSHSGKMLALYVGPTRIGYEGIRVWDPNTGAVINDIEEPNSGGGSSGLSFTPDDRFLIWSNDRREGYQLMVRYTNNWRQAWGMRTYPRFAPGWALLSPNGALIAMGGVHYASSGKMRPQLIIVNVEDRSIVNTIDAFKKSPGHFDIPVGAWHPDSIHIAVGTVSNDPGENAIKIFDALTGAAVAVEAPGIASVKGIAYTADGRYLVESGIGKTVRIWDGNHSTLLQTIPIDGYAVATSADSRYLAIGADDRISIWEFKSAK